VQGLLYQYLQDFVERRYGLALWLRARDGAGVPERFFVLTRDYPDSYVDDLLDSLRAEIGDDAPPPSGLLFDYGRHLGRCFERDFDVYFHRFVSAREMIAAIETMIHAELRRRKIEPGPPVVRSSPLPGGGLRLVYDSPRRRCDVLRGLLTHAADAFAQNITIEEPFCTKRGHPACELKLTFARSEFPRSDASPP
jgi:hypothetical protein